MRIPSALQKALAGAALLSLWSVGASVAHAQQARANTAGRARNLVHPPALPRPARVAPRFAPPLVRPIGGIRTQPVPSNPAPIHRVRPISARPAPMPKPVIAGPAHAGVVRGIQPAASGIVPLRVPPETRRMVVAPAPDKKPAISSVPGPPRSPQTAVISSPLPPPGSQVYCSPTSVMYNMGSLCFNPNINTIDPAFFPWGLWSPPPFINVPGFVSPFVPGLLVRYCPQCTAGGLQLGTGATPFGEAGLHPRGLPPDIFSNPAFEVTATPEPPVTASAPETAVSGPSVILVLANGSRALVSRYWLGQDWLLHFITVNGERRAIPLNALNLQSTGAVNYARGVTFVMPGWPEPRK